MYNYLSWFVPIGAEIGADEIIWKAFQVAKITFSNNKSLKLLLHLSFSSIILPRSLVS